MSARIYAISAACIILFSAYLRKDALTAGFVADDFAQIAMMRDLYPIPRAPLSLFTFSDGSATENQTLRDSGFYPWWSHPNLRIAMWRPLSSALMWLDLSLFDLNARAYHLHSLVWWIAMLAIFASLLYRLLPPAVSLFAIALFVLDEAHGLLLGWIAMRNAIVAVTFALLALLLRYRAVDSGDFGKRWLALIAFALALLSSEYAIAFAGYLFLLEWTHSKGVKRRILATTPWVVLLTLYFVVRATLGFGSNGSGTYINPFSETIEFLSAASVRLPVLAGELALGIHADFWTSGFRWTSELAQLGIIPENYVADMLPCRLILQRVGLFALIVLLLIIGFAACSKAGRRARFLFLGAPLALVPVLSPLPESRVLLPALVGFTAAFGTLLYTSLAALRSGIQRPRALLVLAFGIPLLVLQILSGLFFGFHECKPASRMDGAIRLAILTPKLDAPFRLAKRVLLFGAADATTSIYIPLVRKVLGRPAPDSVYLITRTFAQHRFTRVGPSEFVLDRLYSGYSAGDAYSSTFNNQLFRVGQRFSVKGMQVTVERVYQGQPTRTRFVLDLPLDDPRVLPLTQTKNGLMRLAVPAVGRAITLPSPDLPYDLLPFSDAGLELLPVPLAEIVHH